LSLFKNLTTPFRIQKNDKYSKALDVPKDYSLSFDLTPTGVVKEWSSILHFSSINSIDNNSRMPAIWFAPRSLGLHVRVDTLTALSQGIWESPKLPINCKTKVTVQLKGRIMALFYNETSVSFATLPSKSISGRAALYVANPWYSPAKAIIGNIELNPITDFSFPFDLTSSFTLAPRFMGRYKVPLDYQLSFDLIPTGIEPGRGNILHFTSSGIVANSSQIPAIWFHPGTLKLYVRTDTQTLKDQGISDAPSLPLNAKTRITVEASDRVLTLYYNETSVAMVILPAVRIGGEAELFSSDSWNAPAKAIIGDIQLKAMNNSLNNVDLKTPFRLTRRYAGKVTVPPNYAITFDLTPKAIVSNWASIFHCSIGFEDLSRVPAVWFTPGGTQLHIRFSTKTNPDDGNHFINHRTGFLQGSSVECKDYYQNRSNW
jgi:hypothetical protein